MFLIKRNRFLLLALFVTCSLLGIGVYGYSLLSQFIIDNREAIKFFAEKILFLSIVLAVGHLIFITGLMIKSVRIDKELDKIIQLNKYQDFSPKKSMEKLGVLGERITTLYNQLNQLNEQKTRKISALTELNSFLVNNINLPLFITDIRGTIIQLTETMVQKVEMKKAEIVNQNIDDIIAEISFQSVLFELSRLHSSIEKQTSKNTFTCYPIHNKRNEIVYIVFVLEKKAVYQHITKEGTKQAETSKIMNERGKKRPKSSFKKFLSRLFLKK